MERIRHTNIEPRAEQAAPQQRLRALAIVAAAVIVLRILIALLDPLTGGILVAGLQPALIAVWCFWRLRNGRRLPATPLDLPLALLLVAGVCSALLAAQPRMALETLREWLWLSFLFYAFADLMTAGFSVRLSLNLLLLVGSCLLFAALWDVSSQLLDHWRVWAPPYPLIATPLRLAFPLDHPNQLAAAIYLLLPFAIVKLWHARAHSARLLWALWLLGAEIVLFFTTSRGGWLGALTAVGSCILLLLLRQGLPAPNAAWPWLRARLHVLGVVALYAGIFAALLSLQLAQVSANRGGIAADSGRQGFWDQALALFAQRPLLGGGAGAYAQHYTSVAGGTYSFIAVYAHNWLLNMLAEQGVVGALCFVALIVVCVRLFARYLLTQRRAANEPSNPASPPAAAWVCACCAAWLGLLVHSAVEMPFTIVLLFALYIGVVGLHLVGALRPRVVAANPQVRFPLAALLCLLLVGLWWAGAAPVVAEHAYDQALSAAAKGNWRDAATFAAAAADADPQLSMYYSQWGYALAMAADGGGDLSPALAAYEQEQRIAPGYIVSQLNYAALLDQAGQPTRAAALLDLMAKRDPGWPLPHLLLGRALERTGSIAAARDQFAALLRLDNAYASTVGCRTSPICADLASHLPPEPADTALSADGAPEDWLTVAEGQLRRGDLIKARYALANTTEPAALASPGLRERFGLAIAEYRRRSGQPEQALEVLRYVSVPAQRVPSNVLNGKSPLSATLLPQITGLLATPARATVYEQIAALAAAAGDGTLAHTASQEAATLNAQLKTQQP